MEKGHENPGKGKGKRATGIGMDGNDMRKES